MPNVSPLNLHLDDQNPRFIILNRRDQNDIRRYLVAYEDACQLASGINEYGSLLPGERIVVLLEGGRYVVVEGNRRACALQLLLSRQLIPQGFEHKIPVATEAVIRNCSNIEVDVLPDRAAAITLMTKRHIEGVKQWKPLAKKQFFASNFQAGTNIENLSRITDISQAEIKSDIRDYKFFLWAFNNYRARHEEYNPDIILLDISPFLRIFSSKVFFHSHEKIKPVDLLKIVYDDECNTVSQLEGDLFSRIVLLVFEQTTVRGELNTRNSLTDVNGITPLLEEAIGNIPVTPEPEPDVPVPGTPAPGTPAPGTPAPGTPAPGTPALGTPVPATPIPGGPAPGGPPPSAFFEAIRWSGKLDPSNLDHTGLLTALYELFNLSIKSIGRQSIYKVFPVATGMILRTVYEQTLKLQLMKVGLWGNYCASLNGRNPMLSSMENFINRGVNKTTVLPSADMVRAFDRIIAASHREFLNANIHSPGDIRVSPDSLVGIANGGMFKLIQSIIERLT